MFLPLTVVLWELDRETFSVERSHSPLDEDIRCTITVGTKAIKVKTFYNFSESAETEEVFKNMNPVWCMVIFGTALNT